MPLYWYDTTAHTWISAYINRFTNDLKKHLIFSSKRNSDMFENKTKYFIYFGRAKN